MMESTKLNLSSLPYYQTRLEIRGLSTRNILELFVAAKERKRPRKQIV